MSLNSNTMIVFRWTINDFCVLILAYLVAIYAFNFIFKLFGGVSIQTKDILLVSDIFLSIFHSEGHSTIKYHTSRSTVHMKSPKFLKDYRMQAS